MSRPRQGRFRFLLLGMILAGSSCGGDEAARLTEPVVGGDLVLIMQPGEGTETDTGRYLVESFDQSGRYGLREGTADHVGWIDSEYGPRHVVTFRAGRDNPRGGEPELCVIAAMVDVEVVRDAAAFNGGGACGLNADEPIILGGNLGGGSRESDHIPLISGGGYGSANHELAEVYGGPDGAEAVITTESGKTVSILTAQGFALAEWPREWGLLQMVDFYDTTGDLVATVELQAYPAPVTTTSPDTPTEKVEASLDPAGSGPTAPGVAGEGVDAYMAELNSLMASAGPGRIVGFVFLAEGAHSGFRDSQPYCVGAGGFADITPGTEVTVRGDDHTATPDVTILWGSAVHNHTGCRLWFGLDVAEAGSYTIGIGTHSVTFDASEMLSRVGMVELWSSARARDAECGLCDLSAVLEPVS